jgi:hypothetical protein
MRLQEEKRLRKLARKLDVDYQEFDFKAFGYDEIKDQIYRRAGVKTDAMKEKEFLLWDAVAEQYDNLSVEEKVFMTENVPHQEFINILVLSFTVHDYSLAKVILLKRYRGNMMPETQKANKQSSKIRMMWFMGRKETTDRILRELIEKHNLRPRIIRDSFCRRDFVHYANGKLYYMKRRDFRDMQKKQSIILEEEQRKMQESS